MGPANKRHLLILDRHTTKANVFETHNASRKLPSAICHVEVLVRNLAAGKAFGAEFWKSASGLRSPMRKVQYQIQGTRRELGNALDLLLRAVYVYTYEIGLWYPKTAASSVDQNLKRLRTDGHVNGILRSIIDRA